MNARWSVLSSLLIVLSGAACETPAATPSAAADGGVSLDGALPEEVPDEPDPPVIHELELLAGAADAATELRDIASHPAREEIAFLYDRGVIAGFGDGTFRATAAVTRAQFAAMIARAFLARDPATAASFSDVPSTHWASTAIGRASAAGFLRGYPDGSFRPEQTITRVEAAVALANGLGLAGGDWSITASRYNDSSQVPAWARTAIANADRNGLFANLALHAPRGEWLRTGSAASRGDVASYVYFAQLVVDDWGVETTSDVSRDYLVAGPASRAPIFACVDGVVYGSAAAFSAAGLGVMWAAAAVEPTPAGEIAAAAASAPIVGYIGGSVGIAVSGARGCFAPLARLAWRLVVAGYGQMARGLRVVLMSTTGAASTAVTAGDCAAASARICTGAPLRINQLYHGADACGDGANSIPRPGTQCGGMGLNTAGCTEMRRTIRRAGRCYEGRRIATDFCFGGRIDQGHLDAMFFARQVYDECVARYHEGTRRNRAACPPIDTSSEGEYGRDRISRQARRDYCR